MAYERPEPLGKQHKLDDFACGEPALDEWLKRHARGAHASGWARVFVTTLEDGQTVVGYYALAAAQVAPDEATERALKVSRGRGPCRRSFSLGSRSTGSTSAPGSVDRSSKT